MYARLISFSGADPEKRENAIQTMRETVIPEQIRHAEQFSDAAMPEFLHSVVRHGLRADVEPEPLKEGAFEEISFRRSTNRSRLRCK